MNQTAPQITKRTQTDRQWRVIPASEPGSRATLLDYEKTKRTQISAFSAQKHHRREKQSQFKPKIEAQRRSLKL